MISALRWEDIPGDLTDWAVDKGPKILLILVLAAVVARGSRRVVARFEDRLEKDEIEIGGESQRAATLATLLGGAVSIVVWVLAALSILGQLGVEIAPILASAGIVGIAVGFGAQSLVRDFLTGFFILLEGQFRVGDRVELGDELGEGGVLGIVERFSMRRTAIRSRDGVLHHVANGEIKRASNASSKWSVAIIDIGIPAGEPMPKVSRALLEAGIRMESEAETAAWMLAPPSVLGLEDISDGMMTVRVAIKTMPGRRRSVARVYRRWVKEVFDEVGINLDPPDDVVLHQGVYVPPPADAPDGELPELPFDYREGQGPQFE
jgi:small conductance mechanosensitive channel